VNEPRRQNRTPWYIAGGAVVAAVAVVIAVLIGAGGSSDDESSGSASRASQEALPPHIVRDSEIEAQDSGSPQRALLEWWQAFQFGDARGVIERTSEGTLRAIGEAQLTQLVKERGQGLQGLEVLGATEEGDDASVRAGLLTFQPEKEGEPPPKTPTASRPATFTMLKEGDEWRFRETAFLAPLVQGLERSGQERKQQREKQKTNTQTTETAPE
jgi:hypothetical protein